MIWRNNLVEDFHCPYQIKAKFKYWCSLATYISVGLSQEEKQVVRRCSLHRAKKVGRHVQFTGSFSQLHFFQLQQLVLVAVAVDRFQFLLGHHCNFHCFFQRIVVSTLKLSRIVELLTPSHRISPAILQRNFISAACTHHYTQPMSLGEYRDYR